MNSNIKENKLIAYINKTTLILINKLVIRIWYLHKEIIKVIRVIRVPIHKNNSLSIR